ncbi:hypothetical protein VKT23_010519 [Stygiomarasmius scandens]|uniref:Uncharacterized protein n=1 Tax=Marasmiellus scandens TaxID=2682957 RepID=A0ABR1JBW6_9AGAR
MRLQLVLTSFHAILFFFLCLLVPQSNALDLSQWPIKIAFDEVTSLFNPEESSELRQKLGDISGKVSSYSGALLEEIDASIRPSVEPLINDLQSKISSVASSPGLQALRTELESHLLAKQNLICKDSGNSDPDTGDSSRSCSSDKEDLINGFFKLLITELESAMEKFRAEFSKQTSAEGTERLSYQQRKEAVEALMDRIEEVIINVMHDHAGVPKETTREHLAGAKAGIVSFVVFFGDYSEQYPWIFKIILYYLLAWIFPHNCILKIILRCFGLGPIGPVKGSPAAWAQRIFFGPTVTKGSWFSMLQHLAMKEGGWC